ncbi:MAG: hypothetical protein RR911_02390 [Oscillospiraceae bacterium]
MANQRKTAGVNVGGASIIMVFSVLCLTIFAVLTLVSANAESTLAKKSVASVENYYSADAKVTDTLSKVYQIVDEQPDLQGIKSSIAKISNTITVTDKGGLLLISYDEKIDDGQKLVAELSTDGKDVSVKSWKIQRTAAWQPDDSMDVFMG